MNLLKDKKITLGISGGIAAYKSLELIRLLKKHGTSVKVIMSRSAQKFIGITSCEALSGQSVYADIFEHQKEIHHVSLAQDTDLLIVAPATMNTISKFANGICDNALSTFFAAFNKKIVLCPSMNAIMYESFANMRNLKTLEENGATILEEEGNLACGTIGKGRMPDPKVILDRIINAFSKKTLKGKKILITAGPTIEAIDPVRFISNHSSGKMGYSLAKMAEYKGASVTLITGKTNLRHPHNVKVISVRSAQEMYDATFANFKKNHITIKAAAVADYKPCDVSDEKIKKNDDKLNLKLTKTKDILKEIGQHKEKEILVGFAAETQNLEQNALKKLKEKNLDLLVANKVGGDKTGFNHDTNQVTIFFKNKEAYKSDLLSKDEIANIILDQIETIL